MGYYIIENDFAPKVKEYWNLNHQRNSHAILVNYCNYHCNYCYIDYASRNMYREYSESEFTSQIARLLPQGNCFKFSGGEPTLCPTIIHDLQIIKEKQGKVFLDTNGSNVSVIQQLADQHLVDVLGVSIKGLSPNEAIINSGIKNHLLCWDNVMNSIKYACNAGIHVIVTLVCYEPFSIENIRMFACLFMELPSVVLKFNNLELNENNSSCGFIPLPAGKLAQLLTQFIKQAPMWKGRIVIIDHPSAVHDYDEIHFM